MQANEIKNLTRQQRVLFLMSVLPSIPEVSDIAVMNAAANGDIASIEAFETLDVFDDSGRTPLMFAAASGNLPVYSYIHSRSSIDTINAVDIHGYSAPDYLEARKMMDDKDLAEELAGIRSESSGTILAIDTVDLPLNKSRSEDPI